MVRSIASERSLDSRSCTDVQLPMGLWIVRDVGAEGRGLVGGARTRCGLSLFLCDEDDGGVAFVVVIRCEERRRRCRRRRVGRQRWNSSLVKIWMEVVVGPVGRPGPAAAREKDSGAGKRPTEGRRRRR